MAGDTTLKLPRESTQIDIKTAIQGVQTANQNILTGLTQLKASLDTNNTTMSAFSTAIQEMNRTTLSNLTLAVDDVLEHNTSLQALSDIYATLDEVSTPENGAMIHNSLARGKFLGSNLSEELYNNIAAGTFKGLWAGDYVTFTDVAYTYNSKSYTYSGDWLWGDCNYRIHTGNPTEVTRNHGVMIPRESLFNARMNSSDTTAGGYVGSEMYNTHLKRAEALVKACFGEGHVVPYYPIFVNAVANGKPSGNVYPDARYIDLMNEPMVYGHYCFSSGSSDGTTTPVSYDMDKSQLAIFKHDHSFEHRRSGYYWLRDVVTGAWFADVHPYGYPAHDYASSSVIGVRPAALIG